MVFYPSPSSLKGTIIMNRIVLTEFGEELVDFGEDENEKICLISYIGCHIHGELSKNPIKYFVYLMAISKTHNVAVCAKCGRITPPIPKEVDTYGRLRQWCADEIARKSCDSAKVPTNSRVRWSTSEDSAREAEDARMDGI